MEEKKDHCRAKNRKPEEIIAEYERKIKKHEQQIEALRKKIEITRNPNPKRNASYFTKLMNRKGISYADAIKIISDLPDKEPEVELDDD